MKLPGLVLASVLLMSTALADNMRSVAPALEKYTQDRLLGEVWKRPQLSARDRSIVTLAALIARQQTIEMPFYLNLALDNGVKYTTDVLFRDLWLRPDLAPRDRSLITVTALIANGQVAQMPYHLNRAMDNGLTKEQAGEVLTHLAFYVGWPNVFSALPVAKDVFAKR
jgi:4-carboxymuconolactone decarboxylase